ncbi:MAG: flagellar hook protein FlgE [Desulfovibrio sp.]|nr:MAG: flagellar hook protein FlgE [Desulfovibrio sp.]
MGLSASMWSGVSGLLTHGEKMNVLGNNIANVNTVGFKSSVMHFEDFMYQDAATTAADFGQLGRGVSAAAVFGDFSQGAFETTNEATDLAIGGKGFFKVVVPGSEDEYFTRAGNFRFDRNGYLVDPHGYRLQGKVIESQAPSIAAVGALSTSTSTGVTQGSGSPVDIQLENFTADPAATTNVTMITNLDSENGGDNSRNTTDPFFGLFTTWDAQDPLDPGLPETAYAYQDSIRVYDEGGGAHDLTVYYDQVPVSNAGGTMYWEYIVTIEPEEDNRVIGGAALASSSAAGVLMIGTLTFNSAGQLEDMSAYTLVEDANLTADQNFGGLSNWTPTSFSTNGYPMTVANFTGESDASWINLGGMATNARPIEINFGIRNTVPQWDQTPPVDADAVGIDENNLAQIGSANVERNAMSTTSYAGASSTMFQAQDGYTFGFLQQVTVDRDGILSGRYSNGVTLELYEITLYDFYNKTALRREGGNLFSQTLDSGDANSGPANRNGFGSISSNSLEQSNVDLAREFVQMITTQRGFSANGKVITTTDQMLAEVIMLKR